MSSTEKLELTEPINDKVPVADLVRRCGLLHGKLVKADSSNVTEANLRTIKESLAVKGLLRHKDKGVRILVACCIAEVLRLYSPNPPYTESETRDIFDLILQQIDGLRDTKGPYYNKHLMLLNSLASSEACCVLSLVNAEELIVDIFKTLFDAINKEHSPQTREKVVELIAAVIVNNQGIAPEALDVLLEQFLESRKREHPEAHLIARELINRCHSHLSSAVSSYFNAVIIGESEHALPELNDKHVAHQLMYELFKANPSILIHVMPQLNEELKVSDEKVRMLSTRLVGQMLTEKDSQMAHIYPQIWMTWLQKLKDASSPIRLAAYGFISPVYKFHADFLASHVDAVLAERALDPDDKMRLALLQLIHQHFDDIVYQVGMNLWRVLEERCLDKKIAVRQDAIKLIGRVVQKCVLAEKSFDQRKVYAWSVERIFRLFYRTEPDIRTSVMLLFTEILLPVDQDVQERTEALLRLFEVMDDPGRQALQAFMCHQKVSIQELEVGLQWALSEKQSSDYLSFALNRLSKKTMDPSKTIDVLKRFFECRDERLFASLTALLSAQLATLDDYRRALADILKRARDKLSLSAAEEATLALLLKQSALTVINADTVDVVLQQLRAQLDATAVAQHKTRLDACVVLIGMTAAEFPQFLLPHLDSYAGCLSALHVGSQGTLTAHVLRALAHCAKHLLSLNDKISRVALVSTYQQTAAALWAFIPEEENGIPPLAYAKEISLVLTALGAWSQLQSLRDRCLATMDRPASLLCLSQMIRRLPDLLSNDIEAVLRDCLARLQAVPGENKEEKEEMNVVAAERLSEIHTVKDQLRVASMVLVGKALTRMTEQRTAKSSSATPLLAMSSQAGPLMQSLWMILKDVDHHVTEISSRSLMKWTAAKVVLKWCLSPAFESRLSPSHFLLLSLVLQDECFWVREKMAEKLIKYIQKRRLPVRYASMLFLMAFEPDKELSDKIKTQVMTILRALQALQTKRPQASIPELVMPPLIYLLSHHPDFHSTDDDLVLFQKYFEFLFEIMADAENVSFLFHLMITIKGTRDMTSRDSAAHILLAELGAGVLRERAKHHGWALTSDVHHMLLPTDMFQWITNEKERKEMMEKPLPESFLLLAKSKSQGSHHAHGDHASQQDSRQDTKRLKKEQQRSTSMSGKLLMSTKATSRTNDTLDRKEREKREKTSSHPKISKDNKVNEKKRTKKRTKRNNQDSDDEDDNPHQDDDRWDSDRNEDEDDDDDDDIDGVIDKDLEEEEEKPQKPRFSESGQARNARGKENTRSNGNVHLDENVQGKTSRFRSNKEPAQSKTRNGRIDKGKSRKTVRASDTGLKQSKLDQWRK